MKNYFKHKLRSKNPVIVVLWVLFFAFAIVAFVAFFGFIFQYLWNWLMPELFGLTEITYWQGVGLFILFKILTGSCGSSSCDSSKDSKSDCKKSDSNKSFSKWKHYDKFWKEEGDEYYKQFVGKQTNKALHTTWLNLEISKKKVK